MKLTNNSEETMETEVTPKLRNLNEEMPVEEEKPEGADIRIKILVLILLGLIVFLATKGALTNRSLLSQIAEQQKELDTIKSEALKYGIKEDDDGNLIIPDIDSDSLSSSANVEEGDAATLDSFAKLLLNWKGQSGYNEVRQTLIDEWGFSEDCKLLTTFMPATTEELNANMNMSEYSTYILSESDEGCSYFLICTVRNTIDGTSAAGTVGLQIKLNNDHNITNITAQTLS